MKLNLIKSIGLPLTLAATIIAAAGCASKSYDKGSAASVATRSAADQVAVLNTKVTDTLGALNALAYKPEGDLRSQFDKFNSAVKELQSASNDLDAKVAAMQIQGQIYLGTWSNQLAGIGSADIRALSAQRMADVTAELNTAADGYRGVKSSFQPFMSDLKDIQTYLNNDLTTGGLSAIKNTVAKTKVDALPVRDAIKKLRTEFGGLGKSLSPIMPGGEK
jgi:hypothetical protein